MPGRVFRVGNSPLALYPHDRLAIGEAFTTAAEKLICMGRPAVIGGTIVFQFGPTKTKVPQ